MAHTGRFKISMLDVFPHGAYLVSEVEQVRDFDKSSAGRPVQAVDKESGLPVWAVSVLDADPEARRGDKTVTVKIAARHQPVPPEASPGVPFRPVEFDGLTVTPYVNDRRPAAGRLQPAGDRDARSTGGRFGPACSAPAPGAPAPGRGLTTPLWRRGARLPPAPLLDLPTTPLHSPARHMISGRTPTLDERTLARLLHSRLADSPSSGPATGYVPRSWTPPSPASTTPTSVPPACPP